MGKKDMTSFCRVSVVKKEEAVQEDVKPKATKRKPKKHVEPAPAPSSLDFSGISHKQPRRRPPFDDEVGSLGFSELDDGGGCWVEDGAYVPPEDEWEEVHDNVGDNMSTGYPSDSDTASVSNSGQHRKTKADQSQEQDVEEAEPARGFQGAELTLEEEIF